MTRTVRIKTKDANISNAISPLWVQGVHNGEPVRQSLGTRSMQEALRQVAAMENPRTPRLKPIEEAVDAYEKHIAVEGLELSTRGKYGGLLGKFAAYLEKEGLRCVADIRVEDLDAFRASRKVAPSTSAKDLSLLRMFLSFALERGWIEENPAGKIKGPRNIRSAEVVPYDPNEITSMLAACDVFGVSSYERLRARALVLILRYTGVRISDAALFSKDRIKNGQIFLRTKKTGGLVFLPVPPSLEEALATLPAPRAGTNSRYYFWNEVSSRRTVIDTAKRTLKAAFRLSGVKGARPHRFRHTLATDLLARGYTESDVADVLGISPAVVHKHYAKWSVARQERMNQMMREFYADAFKPEKDKPPGSVN